jgi:hypothetical protein
MRSDLPPRANLLLLCASRAAVRETRYAAPCLATARSSCPTFAGPRSESFASRAAGVEGIDAQRSSRRLEKLERLEIKPVLAGKGNKANASAHATDCVQTY